MSSQYEDWNSKRFGRVITEDELSKRSDPMWPYKYFNPGTPVSKEKVNELVKGGGLMYTCMERHPAAGFLGGLRLLRQLSAQVRWRCRHLYLRI